MTDTAASSHTAHPSKITHAARADNDTQRDDVSGSDVNSMTVMKGRGQGVGADDHQAERRSRVTNVAMSVVEELFASHQFLRPEDAGRRKSRTPAAGHYFDTDDSDNIEALETSTSTSTEQIRSSLNQTTASTSRGRWQDISAPDEQSNSIAVKTLRREEKVFLTLTYIIVGYLICWMPFHVSFDIMAINRTLIPQRLYDVTYWLAYCNSAINPFLYNFSSPDFHRAFRKVLGRRT